MEEKKRGWVKNVAIVFLTIMLLLTFFSNTIMNRSLPQVAVQYAQSGTIETQIRGSGTVKANESYEVSIDQTREIKTVAVRSGDEVRTGDVLFRGLPCSIVYTIVRTVILDGDHLLDVPVDRHVNVDGLGLNIASPACLKGQVTTHGDAINDMSFGISPADECVSVLGRDIELTEVNDIPFGMVSGRDDPAFTG